MASTRHTEQQWSATAGELRYRGIRPGYAVLHVATGGAIGIAAFVALTSLLSLTLGLLPTVVGAAISGALLLGVTRPSAPSTAPACARSWDCTSLRQPRCRGTDSRVGCAAS